MCSELLGLFVDYPGTEFRLGVRDNLPLFWCLDFVGYDLIDLDRNGSRFVVEARGSTFVL